MDITYLCPRAAKKRFGKVRKCQFCVKHSKPMSWSAPSLSVYYLHLQSVFNQQTPNLLFYNLRSIFVLKLYALVPLSANTPLYSTREGNSLFTLTP